MEIKWAVCLRKAAVFTLNDESNESQVPCQEIFSTQHVTRRQKSENENQIYWKLILMTLQIHYFHCNDPSPPFLKKGWCTCHGQIYSNRNLCVLHPSLIVYLLACQGLTSTHIPHLDDDKNWKKRMNTFFSVILHITRAGGMYIIQVHFWFPLTGDFWTWNYIHPEDDMAICIIFTRSSPVSVLENTIFPSLYSECSVREKERHILCRGQLRICRNSLVSVQRHRIN